MADLHFRITVHDGELIYGAFEIASALGAEHAAVLLIESRQQPQTGVYWYPRPALFREYHLDLINRLDAQLGAERRLVSRMMSPGMYETMPGAYRVEIRFRGRECRTRECDYACVVRSPEFTIEGSSLYAIEH